MFPCSVVDSINPLKKVNDFTFKFRPLQITLHLTSVIIWFNLCVANYYYDIE